MKNLGGWGEMFIQLVFSRWNQIANIRKKIRCITVHAIITSGKQNPYTQGIVNQAQTETVKKWYKENDKRKENKGRTKSMTV